ncbi:hypothetical protein YH65_05810 [Sulfurovum lithotrophicum]|uniref:DUF5644 domain-containing protein n=1 Tax=Sulfurovum lithotrophicum TaxID=206403 RepID=A0A7U4RQJ9_9BACT|nr:hypothetical protein [Sulfurovum lithotrophicum]AKF24958.1 hypothetical protein YH65_05810 [Sulfurovum lithotrophicum]
MSYTLNIKAFFFNAQTDYLPYYKHFMITLDEDTKAVDMLELIKEQNENFAYPEENLVFRINDLVVEGDQPMKEVVEKLGTALQIDPVNAYRSNNGLIINDDDFMQSYELLAPYASEEDLEYYKTLYALHYASETEKFDHDYIGDAILVLAHRLIAEESEHAEVILHTISTTHSGLFECEYENNLFRVQEHTDAIEALKLMVKPPKKTEPGLIDKMTAKFIKKPESKKESVVLSETEGKEIAYYYGGGSDNSEAIAKKTAALGATMTTFSRAHKLSGLTLLEDRKELAFKKAGTTLLDALDSGADILIVEDAEAYGMFKKNLPAIERTMGRDIELTLITTENFLAMNESVAA